MRYAPIARSPMTVEQFLAFEKDNSERHEFVSGEVYRVSGPRLRHNLISQNILRHLHGPARRHGCRVYIENVLVQIDDATFYYPDLTVVCRDPGLEEWIAQRPSLVVEVASPSTRLLDRREKLAKYKSVASLQHYLIVEQRRREVSAYGRAVSGEWERTELVESGEIDIALLGARLTLDQIYEDVPMPPLRIGEQVPEEYFDPDDVEEEDDDEIW